MNYRLWIWALAAVFKFFDTLKARTPAASCRTCPHLSVRGRQQTAAPCSITFASQLHRDVAIWNYARTCWECVPVLLLCYNEFGHCAPIAINTRIASSLLLVKWSAGGNKTVVLRSRLSMATDDGLILNVVCDHLLTTEDCISKDK